MTLSDIQKTTVFPKLVLKYYKKNNIIFNINDDPSFIIIVVVGFIKYTSNNNEVTMTTNAIYGVNEIINNNKHKTAIVAKSDCSLILIPSAVFKNDMPNVYQHYCTASKKKSGK